MADYCTTADLLEAIGEADLINLAREDDGLAKTISSQDVIDRLAYWIERSSRQIRRKLLGRVSNIDSPDSELTADLKQWAVTAVLYWLFVRRKQYGKANPYYEAYLSIDSEIDNVAASRELVADGEPECLPWSSTGESRPEFSRAPEGSGLRDGDALSGFGYTASREER